MTRSTPKSFAALDREGFAQKTIAAVIKDTEDRQAERIEYLVDETLKLGLEVDRLHATIRNLETDRSHSVHTINELEREVSCLNTDMDRARTTRNEIAAENVDLKADLAKYKKFVERQPPMPIFVGVDMASDLEPGAINYVPRTWPHSSRRISDLEQELKKSQERLGVMTALSEFWQDEAMK